MTITETSKILAVMRVTYPNYVVKDPERTLQVWTDMLSEYTYQQVDTALRAYILSDNSGFAPSIGQLVDKIQTVTKPKELNEMEAWSLVSKALKNGYYHAEEEFAKLPPLVQKAVGQPSNLRNWAVTDSESVENVIQSNFLRSYRSEVKRAEEIQKMPSDVQKLIDKVNEDRGIEVKPYAAIEEKRKEWSGVPMPEELKQRLEDMRNE